MAPRRLSTVNSDLPILATHSKHARRSFLSATHIPPTTNTRIDLGLALAHYKGKLPKRLIDTGGMAKKDRITHRIPISSLKEIDAEVKKWLLTAYQLDA